MLKNVASTELNRIINMTIDAVESGQREIYGIYEHTKNECDRIEAEIKSVCRQVRETIQKVEELEKLERSARARLLVVSRDLHTYDERDIEEAYSHSRD